jgi:hypothetical protein
VIIVHRYGFVVEGFYVEFVVETRKWKALEVAEQAGSRVFERQKICSKMRVIVAKSGMKFW